MSAADPAARLMGEVLGWPGGGVEREVSHYKARVGAERTSARDPLASTPAS